MNRAERRRQRKLAKKADNNAGPEQAGHSSPEQQQQLTIQQALRPAVQHHKAGRLPQAERLYRQILEADPNQPDALHLLGVIAHQEVKNEIAIDLITNALAVEPESARMHFDLANALRDVGKLDDAVASYHKALAIDPEFAQAHNNLGNVLKDLGELDDAVASYQRALANKPNFAEVHNNLGLALKDMGNLDDAVASYHKALAIKPDDAEAHNNLGLALKQLGRPEDAVASFHKALAVKPDYAEVHNNLGLAFRDLGKLDAAVASYNKALAVKSAFAAVHNNLGLALRDLGQLDDAVASYHRALAIQPDFAQAHFNLANALRDLRKPEDAVDSYRRAYKIKPDFSQAFGHSALTLRQICDWSKFTAISSTLKNRVRHTRSIVNPFIFLSFSDEPEDQLRCARLYLEDNFGSGIRPVAQHASHTDERIRVAYLSADFREHAVAYLIAELFELHDRDRFEITGISFGPDDKGVMRRRLRQAFDHFDDVRAVSDRAVAELIADRRIHIAVDLTGYTRDGRPGVLASRPAPIQVNYLGYAGTIGADFMDYILVDPFVVPADQQGTFTERLVHMPDCYMISDSQRQIASRTPSRAQAGLPDEGFVFCCFSSSYKITPTFFDLWMRLLWSVPGSVLWLRNANEVVERNLRQEATSRGVDRDRLIFAQRVNIMDHLARHRLADLFLDTLPYNAHATTSDALWAGLPVLTCAGRTFAGRVAGSLLHAIGLPELVTDSLEAYEALALKLARDPDLLAKVREKLARNRATAPLFDSERFCRNLEAAYVKMFETWRNGEAPKPFAVGT